MSRPGRREIVQHQAAAAAECGRSTEMANNISAHITGQIATPPASGFKRVAGVEWRHAANLSSQPADDPGDYLRRGSRLGIRLLAQSAPVACRQVSGAGHVRQLADLYRHGDRAA